MRGPCTTYYRRGNERRDIFWDDEDRRLFLTGLAEAGERFALDVFA